jgi:hypothetical protein
MTMQDVIDTTLFYEECQWMVAGLSFFPGTPGNPISSTNRFYQHDITDPL